MKDSAQLKRENRNKKRAAGYVLKQIWVKPEKWIRIKKGIDRINSE